MFPNPIITHATTNLSPFSLHLSPTSTSSSLSRFNNNKQPSLNLLLRRNFRQRNKKSSSLSVRALAQTEKATEDNVGENSLQPFSVKIPYGDRHILVETGHMGRQASGAVTVTDGETVVYTTVCLADIPSEPSDFFPLSVHYQERFSAAGRTSGGFFKREGKTKDHEVLICRLIDRPLRPTMPKGFYHETQILSWVLSYDGIHSPDTLAMTGAGIAVALSEVPLTKPIAGVRVGLVDGKFVINPTIEEMEDSELDLVLSGTDSAILMIEGYCNFLPEEKLLEAVEIGQEAVRTICKEVETLVSKCGRPKMFDAIKLPPPELYKHVEEISGDKLIDVLQINKKIPRMKALASLEDKVVDILSQKGYVGKSEAVVTTETLQDLYVDDDEDEEVVVDGEVDEGDVRIKPTVRNATPLKLFAEVDVKLVFKDITSKYLRRRIVEGGLRSDGRTPEGIRPINSKCGLLPRAHGSALFTRGETQSLAVVTLGDRQMAQRLDNLEGDDELKRFYLQYTFPPSSVGEVGRVGGPSRREIGHGTLAERSLEPILPLDEEFPYTIRLESTITESNGSSSMASVCGGCLALQDAGVPLKSSIAGIAMGLVHDTKEFGGDGTPLILSDITGSEDASGDMDFKVAGNHDGVTAFQMDIKVGGISLPIMKHALMQAKDGRKLILDEMSKCSPPPARQLSKYAPLIHLMEVSSDKVHLVIGTGGKIMKKIIEDTGVESIDTNDGTIKIMAKDLISLEKAKAIISNLTMVPAVGDIYRNCEIKSILPYGLFVEIAPGREGLLHISELTFGYLEKAEDVFKVGDRVDVKLIEINEKGQLRLSRRAMLTDTDPLIPNAKQSTATATKDRSVVRNTASESPKKAAVAAGDGLKQQVKLKRVKVATPQGNSDEDALSGKVEKKSLKKAAVAAEDGLDQKVKLKRVKIATPQVNSNEVDVPSGKVEKKSPKKAAVAGEDGLDQKVNRKRVKVATPQVNSDEDDVPSGKVERKL